MKMNAEFISVTVSDMERAVNFYEKIFQQKVESKSNRLSVFELDNIKFSLWNASADDVDLEFGDNCAPGFKTSDIEEIHQRVSKIASEIDSIENQQGYKIFHFRDPEGNLIEVFEGSKY